MTQRLEKAYGFIRLQMLKNKNNMRNNYIPDSNQSSDDWNTLFNTTQETGSWAPLPGDTCDTDGGDSSGGPESSCDADDSD